MQTAILIPAYRPTPTLVDLVAALRAETAVPILIVDDGSGPDYAQVFTDCASFPGVEVRRNAVNLGKGMALKHGFNHLLVAQPAIEAFVTADADGQHRPKDILAVAAACDARSLVLGVRAFDGAVPLKSRVGNAISRQVYRFAAGIRLSDTQTGLRGVPRRLAELCLSIRSNRYEFETEQLVTAKNEGFGFKEVAIDTIYLDNNRGTHFHPLRDSFRIYFVLIRYTAASLSTAVIDFIVFALLSMAGVGIMGANLGARTVAVFVQFYLLKRFVFKAPGSLLRLVVFVAYVAVMGFVSAAAQIQIADLLPVGITGAKIIVESLLFVLNFLFLRDLLFVRRPR